MINPLLVAPHFIFANQKLFVHVNPEIRSHFSVLCWTALGLQFDGFSSPHHCSIHPRYAQLGWHPVLPLAISKSMCFLAINVCTCLAVSMLRNCYRAGKCSDTSAAWMQMEASSSSKSLCMTLQSLCHPWNADSQLRTRPNSPIQSRFHLHASQ